MADPVADFLAREQDELEGLDDVVPETAAPVATDVPPVVTNGNGIEGGDVDFLSGGDSSAPAGIVDPLDNAAQLNGNVGDLNGTENGNTEPEQPSGPQYNISMPREVPEKILRWQEEQKERLSSKDNDEEKNISEMKEQARKELAEFNRNRKEQIEKNKKINRESEADFLQERDAERPGKEWERIAGMCEFNPKASKNTKDVSRMRGLLLQMKVAK